jgi:glucosamine--fructose-6-phosphate aminotransferase (isomerizing)
MSNAYSLDIVEQAQALEAAVLAYRPANFAWVAEKFKAGAFERVVLSGMGASLNAAYPAYITLIQSGIPVIFVNTAELLHFMNAAIGSRTLLWLNSQSGESVEVVRLLDTIKTQPAACLISSVNGEESRLARESDAALLIQAGPEATVSVKTYSNMLAVNLLAAYQLCGLDVEKLKQEMLDCADALRGYLRDWEEHLAALDAALGKVNNLVFLGRGSSMAAVWNGALISKEAAKCAFEGLHAAEFRHGPLELAEPGFKAIVFAGTQTTWRNNRALAQDLIRYGADVIWVDRQADWELKNFALPQVTDSCLPLAEILAGQALSVVMARRKGIEPGSFRYVGKVTLTE